MTDITALLLASKRATGPDRELDGRVMFAMFAKPCGERGYLWPEDDASWAFAFRFQKSSKEARKRIDGETIEWEREDGSWILMNSLRVPPLTSSLDATVALVRKVRPNADYGVDYTDGKPGAYVAVLRGPLEYFISSQGAQRSNEPLALLAALLRSMIEEEGK